jgi:hypothetical protein
MEGVDWDEVELDERKRTWGLAKGVLGSHDWPGVAGVDMSVLNPDSPSSLAAWTYQTSSSLN